MRQTALITGASSGIGYELSQIFAENQYNLVLIARRQEKLQEIQANLKKNYQVNVIVISQDLAQNNAAQVLFDTLNQQKIKIDVLVNNAGFGDYGFFVESNWEKMQQMIQLNIMTLTHLTRLFLPGMIQRSQGKILNLGSIASFQPGPLMAVYFATKAYILSFTEGIANELQGTGVTATVLCPGPTASEFQVTANQQASKLIKGKKLAKAAEVAQLGYQALTQGKTVVVHGLTNKLLIFSNRLAPRNLVTQTVRNMLAEDK
ncbi:MAG: SDR family oxidoreductase [Hormoscilla sp. GM7CHS1pb]|nr:SDR family oxidoreductase [Hormoscilla sp. GM7CHS1pb]